MEVDELAKEFAGQSDPDEAMRLLGQAERVLWEDLATIPLFAHPSVVASVDGVPGVTVNPGHEQVFWNIHNWAWAG